MVPRLRDEHDDVVDELLRHREWALRLARRLVRDADRADDVVQQALLAALVRPPARLDLARPWLARVVRSWAARTERSRARRDRHEKAAACPDSGRPDDDAVGRADLHRVLVDAVCRLRDPYRSAILLRYFEGLPLKDVAARQGVGLETVRTRVRRALERLRALLEPKSAGGSDRAGLGVLLHLSGTAARRARPSGGPDPVRVIPRRRWRGVRFGAATAAAVAAGVTALVTAWGVERAHSATPVETAAAAGRSSAAVASATNATRARTERDVGDAADVALADALPPDASASAPRPVPLRAPEGEIGRAAPWVDPSAAVTSLAFTPDGSLLAAGASDGTVKLRTVPGGTVVRTLRGHTDQVTCIAVTDDGAFVISGGLDRTIRIWDADLGRPVATLRLHDAALRQVVCGPSGLAASSDVSGRVVVWRVADRSVEARLSVPEGAGHAASLAFSPDSRTLAAASADHAGLATWSIGAAAAFSRVPTDVAVGRACRFDRGGAALWTTTRDGIVLSTLGGSTLRRLGGAADDVTALEVVPANGSLLAGSRDGTVRAWPAEGADPMWTVRFPEHAVTAIAATRDGSLAACASDTGRIRLLDLRTGRAPAHAEDADAGHAWAVSSLAADSFGRFVASGSWDGTVKLWDLQSRRLERTLRGHTDRVIAVDVSPCGWLVASASHDTTLRLWDAGTGECVRTFTGHADLALAVRFDPEGRYLLSGSQDRDAILWDRDTGAVVRTLRGHTDDVRAVAFLPGARVATASEDRTIRIWDRDTGRVVRVLEGHEGRIESMAPTPDGERLVSCAHDGTVRVWDASTGACLRVLRGHAGQVHAVAVSSDCRHALSAGHDADVRRWDLATGESVDVFRGHNVAADAVAFSPDGRTLLSGGWDKRVLVWNAALPAAPVVATDARVR